MFSEFHRKVWTCIAHWPLGQLFDKRALNSSLVTILNLQFLDRKICSLAVASFKLSSMNFHQRSYVYFKCSSFSLVFQLKYNYCVLKSSFAIKVNLAASLAQSNCYISIDGGQTSNFATLPLRSLTLIGEANGSSRCDK